MDEDELRPVKDFIREADNSKHLLSALHDTAAKRALEVEEKLKAVSTDLTVFLTEHVKNNLNDMLECASSQVWPVDTLLSHFLLFCSRWTCRPLCSFYIAGFFGRFSAYVTNSSWRNLEFFKKSLSFFENKFPEFSQFQALRLKFGQIFLQNISTSGLF